MSNTGRAPKDYNAGAWGRILGRIDKAIASISNRLSDSEKQARELQATQREQRGALVSMLTPEATFEWSEYVDVATDIVYAQCIVEVTRGWAIISDFEYRDSDGNVSTSTPWTSYTTGADMSFVASAAYKGGGYYLYRKALPFRKANDFVSTITVDLRGKAANGDVWLQSSHTFDGNTVPQFRSEPKLVLQWYNTTEKWQVRAIGEADDDTLSVGFYVSDNVELSAIDGFVEGDFTTGVTNMSGNDKRFNVLLGSFTPATKASPRTVYVAAGAFDGASATTDNPDNAFTSVLLSIEIPVSPTVSGIIGEGDITGEYLADTAKRASVNLSASHTPGSESSSVRVSGTIEYDGDSTAYTIGPQDISVGTSGTVYIYFDPALSATTLLTGSKATATSITGKRIFVGVAKGHAAERAFFVFANDEPVISAPFIYASKLEALTATMGTLNAGNAKIGDSVNPGGSLDGIYINPYNYWYDSGVFSVGSASNAITFDGSTLDIGPTVTTSYGSSAPASPLNGDLWYDTTNEVFKRYNSSISDWQIVGSEVEDWRASADRTLINGGQIYTNSITATQINVADLFAETITLTGSISSSNYAAATSGWTIGSSTAEFNNVTIRGTLSGATGTFNGDISAATGTFTGGLSIGTGSPPPFVVTTAGALTATNATITGGVTATTLTATTAGSIANLTVSGDLTFSSYGGNNTATAKITAAGNILGNVAEFDKLVLYPNGTGLTTIEIGTSSAGGPISGSIKYDSGDLYIDGYKIWNNNNLPFSLSSVASGDVIYHNGTNWVNLAKGTDGQVLTLASGLPSWAAAGGGSGDITAVNTPANSGLDGGATSGDASLSLDFSNLTAGTLTDLKAGTIAFVTTGGNMRNIAASNLLFSADGLTTTVTETEITSPGGGSNDQWRERTLTFTNGILTATGTWSTPQDIVAGI